VKSVVRSEKSYKNQDMKDNAKSKNSCFEPPFNELRRIVDFLLVIVGLFLSALSQLSHYLARSVKIGVL